MMVGQEHQNVASIGTNRFDTAQQMRALVLSADASEPDRLISENAAVLRRLMFLDDLELRVVLHPRDEEDLLLGPAGEQAVVVIATVVDDYGARGKRELMGDLHVMD